MKRALMILLLLLLSVSTIAYSEEALFPACDKNGKWGYINTQGAFVIPAQYDSALAFRGSYAVVSVASGSADQQGIIDRDGRFVLEPNYTISAGYNDRLYGGNDTGVWLVTRYSDEIWDETEETLLQARREGFFDIPTGTFSGLQWRRIWPWCSAGRLIPVVNDQGEAGYADRTTGKMVIPCRYFASDPSNFFGGVASVAFRDEAGNANEFFLIGENGETIPLPNSIHGVIYQGAFHDRVMVENDEGLFGYADPSGRVIITPQYPKAYAFEQSPYGIAAMVQFLEEDWGFIDQEGNVLCREIRPFDQAEPNYANGYCTVKTGENTFTLFDPMGNAIPITIDGLTSYAPPMDNGLCRIEAYTAGEAASQSTRRWGFVDLHGNIVAEPLWILPDFAVFSQDRITVVQLTDGVRKIGYLNSSGEVTIPCIYDKAESFSDGLAYVELENRCGYIDLYGNEVFFWERSGE